MTRCPSCAKDVADNARHCGYCGARIPMGSDTPKKTVLGMAVPTEELERRRQLLDEAIASERAAKPGDPPARTLLMGQVTPAELAAAADEGLPSDSDSDLRATAVMPAAQVAAAAEELRADAERDASRPPARTALLTQVDPAALGTQVDPAARGTQEHAESAPPKRTMLLEQRPAAQVPVQRRTMMMGSLHALKGNDALDEWPDPSGWDLGGGLPGADVALATALEQRSDGATVPNTDLGHAETDELVEAWDPMESQDPATTDESAPSSPTTPLSAAPVEAPEAEDLDPHRRRKTVPAGSVADAAALGQQLGVRTAGRASIQPKPQPRRRGLPTANVKRQATDPSSEELDATRPSLLKWMVGVAAVVVLVAILLGVLILIAIQ